MAIRCPTCSRVNPGDAAYCYYDGRGLNAAAVQGPLGLGTLPFPMPFSFSDGHGCANYNQLVLACDRRWNEARTYLLNGVWKLFFSNIGRLDLAALAERTARHADPDLGLCRLLEGLPADPEALRPATLALACAVEDLGALEPGKDYKIEVVIANQGMLLLCGSATTDCDWLSLGDRLGDGSSKLFQTRDTYSLSVRVVGSKLRAGAKPLDGQILINTNGGSQTVTVRATVPVRPFPGGRAGNDVLAGATSPRDIAGKARAHPSKAAVLFEQGTVKAWYESNGWTYPVRGTQAKGKAALQQFFEALGLTRPPHLEIDTERIVCQGHAGKHLTKKVIVRTAEHKFVHAEAHSSQDWIKVLPAATPQGNSIALPLRIEIPPRPGETLHATVTFLGNGQQRFVVPVTLTVAKTDEPEEKAVGDRERLTWILAGAVVSIALAIGLTVVIHHQLFRSSEQASLPTPPTTPMTEPAQPPQAEVVPWWKEIPDTKLTASVRNLKEGAEEDRPIFQLIESRSEAERRKGYEQLAAKLPELAGKAELRKALGQFVAECCVYEPSDFAILPLLRGLAGQFPAEDRAFPPGDPAAEVERAAFWLGVVGEVFTHKAARPDSRRSLVAELNSVFPSALDPSAPAKDLVDQAEKALAEQCYRNLLPTADKSVEQALAIREVLIARYPRDLGPQLRDQEDVKLLALGLSSDKDLWPKLEPIYKACVQSNDIHIGFKLIDLYAKANAERAAKMEGLLAVRWKAAADPKLTQAGKADAIRKRMHARARAARVSPQERRQRFQQLLAESPLSAGKPDGQPGAAAWQATARLAHASTMACILFNKDAEVERFDELIGQVPGLRQDSAVQENKVEKQSDQAAAKESIYPGNVGWTWANHRLTDKCDRDPRRGAYRQVYRVRLNAGQIYLLDMQSTDLTPYLRVETVAGRRLLDDRGANAHILFCPRADGVYHLVASSWEKDATGSFTLKIAPQQSFRIGFPGAPAAPAPAAVEKHAPSVDLSDLASLADKQSNVRIEAFKNLARSLPDNLSYRQAQPIANYLLLTVSDSSAAELEAVAGRLPSLARCRHLLEALADAIANGDKMAPKRAAAVVGGLFGQRLQFAVDEDWRSACRKLLLRHALELTRGSGDDPGKAADFLASCLRDLYKEQGLAFGLQAPDFQEPAGPTAVLERLIRHVAARAARQVRAPEEKAYLERIDRPLRAVRIAAGNDLAHMVLLQRVWIKVLVLALAERAPTQAKKMGVVQEQLDKRDRDSRNLLDQLRSGEETILQVWALALDVEIE